jgi:hypothetical protein
MSTYLTISVVALLTSIIGVPYVSLFEWLFHRNVMHRPLWTPWGDFRYPFIAHATVHHSIFKADETYHLKDKKDIKKIPMEWWNGIALFFLTMPPFILAGVSLWFCGLSVSGWTVGVTGATILTAYYGIYEYVHWCMHWPKGRRIETSTWFRWFNARHILHHRWPKSNFNVVLPLWDWIFGTLMMRSPCKFLQVSGPSVPDVQPC